MQALFSEVFTFLKTFSALSKRFAAYSGSLGLVFLVLGLVARALLGVVGQFDRMLRFSDECLFCGVQLLLIAWFGALILQTLHKASHESA